MIVCVMDLQITWSVLFFCLTSVQVNCNPHLSKQDLVPLAAEPYPACFTRHLSDFTCFWEAPMGKPYDFLYKADDHSPESRCNISQQEAAEGKILHVCFFPPSDVNVFVYTHVRVVDKDTNTTVYNRTLSVEDNCLYYPPSNTSLLPTGKAGQLLVKWSVKKMELAVLENNIQFELWYTSKTLDETVTLVKGTSIREYTLLSLVPGELCTVQIRVKVSFTDKGHWSDWSPPVTVMVPQTADDIELKCYTSDLSQVWCQWSTERYGYANLHYRQTTRNSWGDWKTCDKINNDTLSQCVLYGEERTMFQVYLTTISTHSRTFYMDVFSMNSSIKTDPPEGLKEEISEERFCLTWTSPLPQISEHLIYQVRYQIQGESMWKIFAVQNPSTNICLDVQAGGQYTVQVKALPGGSFYSGHWSAWSKPLTKHLSSNTGLLFIVWIPFVLLIVSVALLSFSSRYFSKLKQVLWPPVPNLNDVLESFLKDIDGQYWELNIRIKQCDDDVPASVLEIMSEKEANALMIPCWASNIPHHQLDVESNEVRVVQGLEMSREYVTLKPSTVNDVAILTGNDYVYGLNASLDQHDERVCDYSSLCLDTFSASTTNIFNHSYLDAEVGNLNTMTGYYTNLEMACSTGSE